MIYSSKPVYPKRIIFSGRAIHNDFCNKKCDAPGNVLAYSTFHRVTVYNKNIIIYA